MKTARPVNPTHVLLVWFPAKKKWSRSESFSPWLILLKVWRMEDSQSVSEWLSAGLQWSIYSLFRGLLQLSHQESLRGTNFRLLSSWSPNPPPCASAASPCVKLIHGSVWFGAWFVWSAVKRAAAANPRESGPVKLWRRSLSQSLTPVDNDPEAPPPDAAPSSSVPLCLWLLLLSTCGAEAQVMFTGKKTIGWRWNFDM